MQSRMAEAEAYLGIEAKDLNVMLVRWEAGIDIAAQSNTQVELIVTLLAGNGFVNVVGELSPLEIGAILEILTRASREFRVPDMGFPCLIILMLKMMKLPTQIVMLCARCMVVAMHRTLPIKGGTWLSSAPIVESASAKQEDDKDDYKYC